MDKYAGCNIVECTVTGVKSDGKKRQKRRGGFFVRLAVSACIAVLFVVLHYAPFPALAKVKDTLHDVFCYDVFGRETGTSAFFEK